jgi:hypothetical protein
MFSGIILYNQDRRIQHFKTNFNYGINIFYIPFLLSISIFTRNWGGMPVMPPLHPAGGHRGDYFASVETSE